MAETRLDWSTAEVTESGLSVELAEKPPSGWKKHFETTVKLLGGGEWGKVRVKKQTVLVQDVSPGAEDKLRHYLEGVVEQANTAIRPPENPPDPSEQEKDEQDEPSGPDAEMTERFRSFAEQAQAREVEA